MDARPWVQDEWIHGPGSRTNGHAALGPGWMDARPWVWAEWTHELASGRMDAWPYTPPPPRLSKQR